MDQREPERYVKKRERPPPGRGNSLRKKDGIQVKRKMINGKRSGPPPKQKTHPLNREILSNSIGWVFSIAVILLVVGIFIYFFVEQPFKVNVPDTPTVYKEIKSQVNPVPPLPFQYACTNSEDCSDGYECDPLHGVCRVKASRPCVQSSDCLTGYYCNDICRDLSLNPPNLLADVKHLFQACPCADGFSCVFRNNLHYCLRSNGGRCSSSDSCASGNCVNSTCADKFENGSVCAMDSECLSSNCSNGFCQADLVTTGGIGSTCTVENSSEPTCNPGLACSNGNCIVPVTGLLGACANFLKTPNTMGCYGLNGRSRVTSCESSEGGCLTSYYLTTDDEQKNSRSLPNQLPSGTESVCSTQFTRKEGTDNCLGNNSMSCINDDSCISNNCSDESGSIYLFQSSNISGKRITEDSFFDKTSSTNTLGLNNVAYMKTDASIPKGNKIKIFGTISGLTFQKLTGADGLETFLASTDNLHEDVFYCEYPESGAENLASSKLFVYEPESFQWKEVHIPDIAIILDFAATTVYYGNQARTYLFFISYFSTGTSVNEIKLKKLPNGSYQGIVNSIPFITVNDAEIIRFDVLDYNGIKTNLWIDLQGASERPSFLFKSRNNLLYYQYDSDSAINVNGASGRFGDENIAPYSLAFGVGRNASNRTIVYPLMTYTEREFDSSRKLHNYVRFTESLDPDNTPVGSVNYDDSRIGFPSSVFSGVSTLIRYHVNAYYYTHENPLYADNNNFTIIANTWKNTGFFQDDVSYSNSLYLVSEFRSYAVPGYFDNDTILYTSSRNTFIFSSKQCVAAPSTASLKSRKRKK